MAEYSDVSACNSFADRSFRNAPDNQGTETAKNLPAEQTLASNHQTTDNCNSFYSLQFIMVPKVFSEGIVLRREGPSLTSKCDSMCIFSGGKSFRTSVSFIPKYIKKYFTTILKVDDDITYYESIELERKTVMQDFSETVNSFPKEMTNVYCPSILYDPDSVNLNFIAGLELLFMRTLNVSLDKIRSYSEEGTADVFQSEKTMIINDSNGPLVNGEV